VEGKYIKYELTQTTAYNEDSKYFKDDEIYRIGIEFLIIMDSFLTKLDC
jgi:hypothetical protein